MSAPLSPSKYSGFWWGGLGVLAFSLTLPLTRLAVIQGLSPLFIASARAVVASVLAGALLVLLRQPLPRGRQWLGVVVVSAGVVFGFPLLTSFALQTAPASHGAVIVALLPAATAVAACLRTGERPRPRFWWLAGAGALAGVAFAAAQGGGLAALGAADILLLAAVLAAACGYAEGGVLARTLGSWQTISWALVVAAPLMLALTLLSWAASPPLHAGPLGWAAFGYLAVVSMFLGFVAWYRGLAVGPLLSVSQMQLVQPVLSIVWAVVLLSEELSWATVCGGLVVMVCAALAVRARA